MTFQYKWKNKEANFGPPIESQILGGMHLAFEIILKKDEEYIALRRPKGIPEHELPPRAKDYPDGLLYFCHNLIRYGESVEDCVQRIVKSQAGVGVKDFRVVYIDSSVQDKDDSWAIVPHVIAEVEELPKITNELTEVVLFTANSIPGDFAWWSKEDFEEFLDEHISSF
ncbi:MAG: hypothetical protein G01um101444_26 [Parcubacteria group bacterium Gr01-1014_44]|nr:MAG: hypothetical protein G01um101444_26 [Parcubacteria group bacterium Gr01-1014_44]